MTHLAKRPFVPLHHTTVLTAVLVTFLVTFAVLAGGCGDVPATLDAGAPAPDAGPVGPQGFAEEAAVLTASFGDGDGQVCLDLTTRAEVSCDEALVWDVMFETAGPAWNIWTNGRVHGAGRGAAFGPMSAAFAEQAIGSPFIPGWFEDVVGGAVLAAPWYTYNVLGTNDISANQRVYAVRTGEATFKLQVRSYYGEDSTSAHIQLLFGPIEGGDARSLEVDATAGGFGVRPDHPDNHYAYVDLDRGVVLDLDDEAVATNGEWDVAFKRFLMIANGGLSGPGAVETALAAELPGLYDEDGGALREGFEALTVERADGLYDSVTSAEGLEFVADHGQPFIINDGGEESWFRVEPGPNGPIFAANPDVWWAVRGATWDTYAKFHVTDVEADGDQRAFTAAFYIQDVEE